MERIIFYIIAVSMVIFAIKAVSSPKMLRAVIYLLFVLIGIAGIYFLVDYAFLAAVQLAAGIAQVNMIKSSSFGGGGAPSLAGSGSGSIPAMPTIDAAEPSEAIESDDETTTTNKNITINFLGDGRYSKDEVRDLIEQINEEIGDGAILAT